MIKIELTRGFVALVDDEDFELVSKYKWSATSGRIRTYAQARMVLEDGGYTVIHMHRLIMGFPQKKDVDHINGEGTDNRRSNLRICNRVQNSRNQNGIKQTNTSGVTGVSFFPTRNKWCVRITAEGKYKNLGYYESFEEAVKVRRDAEQKYYGDFAPKK